MDFGIIAGDVDQTIYVRLRDSTTGLAKTGLVFNSAGAVCSYTLPGAARAAITLATQTVAGAHSDGGFVEVDATNCKGLYRLDLPDAAIASGKYSIISIEFDGIIEESVIVPLTLRKSDLRQLAGDTQSLTDLKDFADAGYDPGTNKVQGVVLVDTTTTNTDMLTAAAVVNEWETQSQADPTGFHVNVLEAAGTAWNSGAIGAATLASDTIAAAKIAAGAITAAKFAAGAIDAAAIANGAIDAATFAADVDAEILSYLVDDATRIDASALNTAAATTIPSITSRLPAALTVAGNIKADIEEILEDATAVGNLSLAFGVALGGTGNDRLLVVLADDTHGGGGTTITSTFTGNLSGNVGGKVLGGGSSSLIGVGVNTGDILIDSAIDTVNSQTDITITAGSDDNDAYNYCEALFFDQVTSEQRGFAVIDDYIVTAGPVRRLLLKSAPQFTVVSGDLIRIKVNTALKPATSNRTLGVNASGHVERVTLVDTTTTNTDMRGTDSAATAAELAKVPKSDGTATWNATAAAQIQTEANDALIANNLDHLCLTATAAADMTAEVADNTIIARILANGDTSVFDPSTDGLQPIRDTAPLGTAMRGTDNAALASVCTEARLAELDAANLPADVAAVKSDTAATLVDTGTAGVIVASFTTGAKAEIEAEAEDALQIAVADSIPADGSLPSVQQAVYMILQALIEGGISGTTWTIKKADGTTTLFTVTLDDATTPTSKTRAT